jgi:hypothetical protein
MAMGYGLSNPETEVQYLAGTRNWSPQRPDRLWVSSTLLFNGCRWLFPSGRGMKLTTHLYLASRLRMSEAYAFTSPYVFMVCCLIKCNSDTTDLTPSRLVLTTINLEQLNWNKYHFHANFPHFEKIKGGLRDRLAICPSLHPSVSVHLSVYPNFFWFWRSYERTLLSVSTPITLVSRLMWPPCCLCLPQ